MKIKVNHEGWKWSKVKDLSPWQKPDGFVMNLIYDLGPDASKTVYDLGCGIGRHTIYFASHGYQVYASDISQEALKRTQEWLNTEGLQANLQQGHYLEVDYPDNYFDLVVSMNVLNHGMREDVYAILSKIQKMLKPGGIFCGTLRIKEKNVPFPKSDKIELLDDQTVRVQNGEETGILHYFAYVEEIPDLFQGYELGRGSFVYVKIYEEPFTRRHLQHQVGIEILRFSVTKEKN